jgi:predicted nucleic acid-binding protein
MKNKEQIHIKDDPDDDKILECAAASSCECIVSGNKHLIKLRLFRNIKILEPAEFLVLIR